VELRAFAEKVLFDPELSHKITRIEESLTDHVPGDTLRVTQPVRPPNLQFAARKNGACDAKSGIIEGSQKASHCPSCDGKP
jgi:hypothetical protein